MVLSDSRSTSLPLHSHLVAAEALPEGDPNFVHTGVRISIHGLFPSDAFKMYPDLRLWAIDVEFNAARSKPFFHAWCVQNEMVPQSEAYISFVLPIVDALNLRLSTKRSPQHQPATFALASNLAIDPQQAWLQFSLGREAHTPKLQRRIYFIALPSVKTGRLPNWRDYELRADTSERTDTMTGLRRRDRHRYDPGGADFAYVKLAVDYAKSLSIG
ncbi:hypothetical protein C2W62_26745 [Candidatus Entotheonella serta]|nr:hypothetical protein C2W62_26745 [Candidatus Entotheonella serta]